MYGVGSIHFKCLYSSNTELQITTQKLKIKPYLTLLCSKRGLMKQEECGCGS